MKTRRWCAVLGAPAVCASLIAVAPPAWAKSDIALDVSAGTVRVGHPVEVTATGDDDAAPYTSLCIQIRRGESWRDLGCSQPAIPSLEVTRLRERHATVVQLRAAMFGTDRAGHRLFLSRVSRTLSIRFVTQAP